MPSRFSGLGRKSSGSKAKPIPLFNPKPAYDPGTALIAANAMVAQTLKSLHDILKGPMAPPCPTYLRAYAQTAAKNLVDLQQQFATCMPGTAELDEIRIAASELLSIAAMNDEDQTAEQIADVLEKHSDASTSPALVSTVMASEHAWTEVKEVSAFAAEDKVIVSGSVDMECNGSTVEMEFDFAIPLMSTNLKIKNIK